MMEGIEILRADAEDIDLAEPLWDKLRQHHHNLHDGAHFAQYNPKWNTLGMSYEEFQAKSDAELNTLFCIPEDISTPNPLRDDLEALLPSICKELANEV